MESSSLVPVLSYILTKMVERNDKIPLDDSKRNVFHAQKAPLISLHRYLERVLSFAPCSNSCFIIALIYIDRIIQNNSDFILNSLSVHRMLITSVMLATKFFDDETFNNLYYAKVGGLQVSELNQLEEKFLSLIEFSLTIRAEVYDRYRCELVKHAKVSSSPKVTMQIPPLHKKAPHETRSPCPKASVQPACQRTLSRSNTSINTRPSTVPASSEAPSLVRSVCEALIVESVQNKNLQLQLVSRVTELLNVEEKLHHRVPPSSVKTLCAKLALENNLSPSLVTRASLQAERLERLEKMESMWYPTGFDYAARDMVPTTPNSVENGEGGNTSGLDFGNLTINNAKSLPFSQCTPTYPNNNRRHMVAVSWG